MRGIRVAGLSRSGENDTVLSTLGAEPRRGDFFDAASLRNIIAGCDVVMHLATAIPKKILVRKGDWLLNDRLHTEGTWNLAEVALANACRLYLQQSVTFVYGDHGDAWIDESVPVPEKQFSFLKSAREMESIVSTLKEREGLPAAIFRLGWLYSADAFHIRSLVGMIKERKYKSIGEGKQYWSLIHADDAASAFIKAVENLDNIAHTAYIMLSMTDRSWYVS